MSENIVISKILNELSSNQSNMVNIVKNLAVSIEDIYKRIEKLEAKKPKRVKSIL